MPHLLSRVLQAFGEAIVPEPTVEAPARLLRLLVAHLGSSKMRKVADARAEHHRHARRKSLVYDAAHKVEAFEREVFALVARARKGV